MLLLICLLVVVPAVPVSTVLTGVVVRIIDGDTLDLLTPSNNAIRVRLYGIDCPERTQDHYQQARQALSELVYKKRVTIQPRGYDRNRRLIGSVFRNKRHINLVMIQRGFAWHFKKYSSETDFAEAEKAARIARLGLWSNKNPVASWDFRAAKKRPATKSSAGHSLSRVY